MGKLKDLENLEKLFSDNEKVLYSAIVEKKDWILRNVIFPGNLDVEKDQNGKEHIYLLEDILNQSLVFDKAIYFNVLKSQEKEFELQKSLQNFNICYLKKNINVDQNYSIYIEYDLTKLSKEDYLLLMPNFYFSHDEKELNINFDDLENPVNLLKICMIRRDNDYCLVLDDSKLKDGRLFFPYISKIYIARKLPDNVINELISFTKKHNITLEVIYETKGN